MKTKLLTTLTAAILALSAWADKVQIDGIYYYLNSYTYTKTASVTSGDSQYQGDITIPASFTYSGETYSVTSIGSHAFSSCTGLTSITIPASVKSIEFDAFSSCTGLTSITIPASVTSIEFNAFWGCTGLTSITIPSSVRRIDSSAFERCTGLTNIKVEADNTKYDSRDNCNAIIETASNTLVAGCKATTIPSSVTSIGGYAFCGCTGLTSIKVAAGNTKYDSRDNCNAIIETASNTLVAGCKATTIPSSVTSIGDYAFYGCTDLTSITIPSSVTSIGGAFCGCTGLTSITIPSSVTSIGDGAFERCTSLTDIYALRTDPEAYNCEAYAFFNVPTSTCTLHVPKGSKEAYANTAPWSYFKNIVEEDLTSIEPLTLTPSEAGQAYYNLQGQRITNPQRGQLVIIRYSDGTSRKVVVK